MNPFTALKETLTISLHSTSLFIFYFFTFPINPSLHFTLLFVSTTYFPSFHFPSLFTFYRFYFPSLVFSFLTLFLKTLAQRRTIARLCALFQASSGVRAWNGIRDRLRRPYYLSRDDRVRKIRDRKQRTVIGKYSFVHLTVKTGTTYLQKR
jgi:hypothetical protein